MSKWENYEEDDSEKLPSLGVWLRKHNYGELLKTLQKMKTGRDGISAGCGLTVSSCALCSFLGVIHWQ